MIEKKPKRKTNYLNNKDMLAELNQSKIDGKMSNELTKMVMMLCKRYGQHPWFINYSYNDDMQSFALLTVVKFWNRFNSEKSSNAFAYFTQIIKRAFYQYKIQEKKHRQIRDSLLVEQGSMPSYTFMNEYDADNYHFEKMDNFEKDEEYKMFDKELSKFDSEVITVEDNTEKALAKELESTGDDIPEIKIDD